MTENNAPSEAFIVRDDGTPIGHIDIDRLQADSTLLMYEMAVTAGDDDATDAVAHRWVARHDADYFGYVAAGALSLMTRNILAPVLDVAETASKVDLRKGLREAYENAVTTL